MNTYTVCSAYNRFFLGVFFGLTVFLLAGCWDRMEVNDLAIVTAVGIDKSGKDSVELSAQIFIPKQNGGGKSTGMEGTSTSSSQTIVRSAEGRTIAEAMSILQEKLPRKIFWGHDEIFIFGENLAKQGIEGHVDFLLRHPQVRERAYVMVGKGKAKDLLELTPPIERSSAETLREMTTFKTGIEVTLKDLAMMLGGDSLSTAVPWIEPLPPEKIGGKTAEVTTPYIWGAAVFKRDKLVGHISDRETRGVLWFRNEIKTSIATVNVHQNHGMVSMNLIRARTELIPRIEGEHWKIIARVNTEDDVLQNTSDLNITDPKVTNMIEEKLKDEVETRMKEALNKIQHKYQADILGFADAFHRGYPKEWNREKEQWNDIFPNVEVEFDIHAYLRRTGAAGITQR